MTDRHETKWLQLSWGFRGELDHITDQDSEVSSINYSCLTKTSLHMVCVVILVPNSCVHFLKVKEIKQEERNEERWSMEKRQE